MDRSLPWKLLRDTYTSINSADELMKAAGLDWKVSLNDVYAIDENGSDIQIDGKFATVRNNSDGSKSVLSVVGNRYNVFQNQEIFQSLDFLIDSDEMRYASAGELGNGKIVYAVMELPDGMQITNDPHSAYILARTSHDGSTSFELTPIVSRLYCTNQMNASFMNSKSKYSLRHTPNNVVEKSIIRQFITVIRKDISNYEEMSNHLLDSSFSNNEFENFIKAVYPISSYIENSNYELLSVSQKNIYSRQTHARMLARSVWLNETDTQHNISGTKFAAFQSVIEAYDHLGSYKQQKSRANNVITGNDIEHKSRVLRLLVA